MANLTFSFCGKLQEDLPAAVHGLSLIFVNALTQNYSNVPFVASYLVVSTSWQAISQKAAEARQ